MIENKWFCEPDDERESWCFLVPELNTEREECRITGLEVGYGNPKKMVRKLEKTDCKEEEILEKLLGEICYCRKRGIPIITAAKKEILTLRTRLLLGKEKTSLQKVELLNIEQLLKEHFLVSKLSSNLSKLAEKLGIGKESSGRVDLLREIYLRIGTLLPENKLPKVIE
ncbi:hypothetical protein AKJ51_00130 [candidate division MSBL1 archaeon SCGC-AAA382A20]|uniref:Uncharacterized protein n=1 Tax=candidate division MSBL1 archaeon SCGC-AAA382A20 TaxID=1698280 RepID=A0A133VMR9_9EURY|nr:hypothetical protein AKJ51_00130 [candidate division MSBL1 archaeon SCGC-AAA382A20]